MGDFARGMLIVALLVLPAVAESRVMREMRRHRTDLRPGQSIYSGWNLFLWQPRLLDRGNYDDEGPALIRRYLLVAGARLLCSVAAVVIAVLWMRERMG